MLSLYLAPKCLLQTLFSRPPLEMGLSFYIVMQAMRSSIGLQSPQDPKHRSGPMNGTYYLPLYSQALTELS